MQVQRMIELLD